MKPIRRSNPFRRPIMPVFSPISKNLLIIMIMEFKKIMGFDKEIRSGNALDVISKMYVTYYIQEFEKSRKFSYKNQFYALSSTQVHDVCKKLISAL